MQRHPFLVATLIITIVFTSASFAQLTLAATTINTNISTGGNLTVSGNGSITGTLGVTGLTTLGNASTTQLTTTGSTYLATTGGNVGVGTASPGAKLDVYGNTTTSNTAQFGTFGIQSYNNTIGFVQANGYWDGSNGAGEIYRNDGTIAMLEFLNGDIWFRSSPTGVAGAIATLATNMIITNSGNVGIGTILPYAPLEIKGAAGSGLIDTLWLSNGNGNVGDGPRIIFGVKTDSYPTWRATEIGSIYSNGSNGGDLVFRTNNNSSATDVTEKMRIMYNGRVGIGTTTPSQKLDVNGSINLEGAANGIIMHDTATASCYLVQVTNGALALTSHVCQ